MVLLAVTIHKNHGFYSDLSELVYHSFLKFSKAWEIDYFKIVKHDNKDVGQHYHAILISRNDLLEQELKEKPYFHFEKLINLEKYDNYMHSHDFVESYVYGDVPFMEHTDGDKMAYDIAKGMSPKYLLMRYGMKALRNMKNIDIYLQYYVSKD